MPPFNTTEYLVFSFNGAVGLNVYVLSSPCVIDSIATLVPSSLPKRNSTLLVLTLITGSLNLTLIIGVLLTRSALSAGLINLTSGIEKSPVVNVVTLRSIQLPTISQIPG